jgi:hypothetical protein
LALTWPRPVLLVEADPTGGSAVLAGYFRGTAAHPGGLIDVVWAHRHGSLAAALQEATVPLPGSSVSLLPGVRTHAQARSLTGVWEPLAATLRTLVSGGADGTGVDGTGQDVIVDAGRLGLEGWPEPLIFAADLMLLTVRTDLVALSGARSWAETLRDGFDRAGAASRLGLLLVGDGRPYRSREVAKVLQVPVTASLAWDPAGAAVFGHGSQPPKRFDTSPLPRSLKAAGTAIEAGIAASRAAVGEPVLGEPARVGGLG